MIVGDVSARIILGQECRVVIYLESLGSMEDVCHII